jgi:hypothetical protein
MPPRVGAVGHRPPPAIPRARRVLIPRSAVAKYSSSSPFPTSCPKLELPPHSSAHPVGATGDAAPSSRQSARPSSRLVRPSNLIVCSFTSSRPQQGAPGFFVCPATERLPSIALTGRPPAPSTSATASSRHPATCRPVLRPPRPRHRPSATVPRRPSSVIMEPLLR